MRKTTVACLRDARGLVLVIYSSTHSVEMSRLNETPNLFKVCACYRRRQAQLTPSKGEFQQSFAVSNVGPDRLRFLSIILKILTEPTRSSRSPQTPLISQSDFKCGVCGMCPFSFPSHGSSYLLLWLGQALESCG